MRTFALATFLCVAAGVVLAQQPTSEYEIKAAFLYNFVRLVEWPPGAGAGPVVICVARANPFGSALEETVRGESVAGRAIAVRVIPQPADDCDVLFIPAQAAARDYLRAVDGEPVLTVGESADFIQRGGMVNFVIEEERVRFEINPMAATRANLRISSRLLQLARLRQPT
jgi:hypothetical protein